MPAPLKLSMSFHPNPRVQPLVEGHVKPEGVEFAWDTGEIGAAFMRVLTKNDFDVFEFSISHYLATRGRGNPAWDGWIAIPVYASKPSAIYRGLYLREDAGIKGLADLRGKRLGIPDFSMTGGIAIRVLLRRLYGIRPQEITWVNTRPAAQRHDNAMGFDHPTDTGIRIENIPEGMTAQQLIERGEVDAVVGAPQVPVVDAPGLQHFALSRWVEALAELQRQIGITPVNHTLLIQKRVLAENPKLGRLLFDTFQRAKEEAYRSNPAARAIFTDFDLDLQRRAFGEDPYPYGLAANRPCLELVAEQLEIDGLIAKRPDVDALIAEDLRNT